ncbi:hypothetical protein [Leucobacter luti]|uniref:Uncharacterized protein n=1 Tax=Leucobacter luti TaxID=340320 RepID=A0A4Q7TXP1_9MICO|nr:hypothetical protein [Leucobacter luti]MBL3698580.1 hypothetical protein [Leucobacter luti]RZT65955.1 hypothetical protein EV139_1379 [Leucobacter luti]
MTRRFTPVRGRGAAAAAALALLMLPLSACSIAIPGLPGSGGSSAGSGSGGSGGGTSEAAASGSKCQVASAAIDRVTSEAAQSGPQLIADALAGEPVDAGALVDPVIEALDAASASITDPAVLAALGEAQTEWSGLATDIAALGAPDLAGLTSGDLSKLGALQEYGGELTALFSQRLPALQETGARLQEACAAE